MKNQCSRHPAPPQHNLSEMSSLKKNRVTDSKRHTLLHLCNVEISTINNRLDPVICQLKEPTVTDLSYVPLHFADCSDPGKVYFWDSGTHQSVYGCGKGKVNEIPLSASSVNTVPHPGQTNGGANLDTFHPIHHFLLLWEFNS